ncbi:hypothetical protein [Salinicola tamaricis]|uniref:hypothetical protein n=1 Tax=Salinicola tamaricis TaxID=1771309 RepID=UPI001F5D3A2B|nr:hypothetical protein [Salinicola tamaricis]
MLDRLNQLWQLLLRDVREAFLAMGDQRAVEIRERVARSSTWLCSRNDLIANGSVVLAAVAVSLTGTLWPDVIVGLAIAALFLHSAWRIGREAIAAWHEAGAARQETPRPDSNVGASACCGSTSCCDD